MPQALKNYESLKKRFLLLQTLQERKVSQDHINTIMKILLFCKQQF